MGEEKLAPISKEQLINQLRALRALGWVPTGRDGNAGGIGNTLEDFLGIKENNLPIPNAAEWEIKTPRIGSASLMTLFHCEPSPRALKFVPTVLLPRYEWSHQRAGDLYPDDEMSFRQTISAAGSSDRGFKVVVDRSTAKVMISFDANSIAPHHSEWLESVKDRATLAELDPQPYWGFNDLRHKAGSKLTNCFYIGAEVKREGGREFFRYSEILMMQQFGLNGLLSGLEEGWAFVDFDARNGHNHGTKFRIRQNRFSSLYQRVTRL